MSEENAYDAVVIGAGPAGLTAGIYCSRAGLKTLVLEKSYVGGQAALTDRIENYPGFPEGINGAELLTMFEKQAKRLGAEIKTDTADKIEKKEAAFEVSCSGVNYSALAVILAAGAVPRKLGIPGEKEFTGRGVSYCATCDAPFFRDKKVAVIGGGDAAVEEALYLTKFVQKVYLIHRRDRLRAAESISAKAAAEPKIEFVWKTVPVEVRGKASVTGIAVKGVDDGAESFIECSGVFVFAGYLPSSGLADGIATLDSKKRIVVNRDMATSLEGLFACGDCTDKKLMQVVTACGDGAVAAFSASKYIDHLKGKSYD